MAEAHEIETALRKTAISFADLLKLCGEDADGPERSAFHQAIETASGIIERSSSVLAVLLAQRRVESGTNAYLRQRGGRQQQNKEELQAIASLLAGAVLRLCAADSSFTRQVRDSSERIQQIMVVDDLATLRRRLSDEVGSLQEAVRAKEEADAHQLAELRIQVSTLEEKLAVSTAEAERDPLTGLHNRRAWDERLKLIDGAGAEARPYSLAMIDLDELKQINDAIGHAAGDQVLVQFGALCLQAFGDGGFVARYGGDEFAALLDAPTPEQAVEQVQRLIGIVRNANDGRDDGRAFTFSVGLAHSRNEPARRSLERADAALYEAKHAGRDRLVIAA